MLETALLNIAFNARDAMPDGGTLQFSVGTRIVNQAAATPEVPAGCYAMITARDTGKGMSAEIVAKAFDPFFTTKPVGQGTGLGLSMVYGFMRQSGGQLQLSSTEGQGTTVTFIFPLLDKCEDGNAQQPSRHAVNPISGLHRVLLVEDMGDVRESIQGQLESLGLEVTTAEDATGARAALSSGQPFDLLLTDLGLPSGMDGEELAAAATKRFPNIKIITMTGYNERRVSKEPLGAYASHAHLRKPFLRSDLKDLLVTLLENRSAI
jgi:CheY-like chemotaxis protein